LAEALKRPLRIGGRPIAGRLLLAPLSKIGHPAFRRVVARYGGFGLMFSGMCAAGSVVGNADRCENYRHDPHERSYLVVQLFGRDPETFATAARRVESAGLFGVDINFGCSVGAVCRNDSGAALLRSPEKAQDIVRAVRRATAIPLWVKFRTGWSDDVQPAVDLARRFEDAGADALTFHPRVAPDRRARPPRWEHIARVKAAVSIPVFGNGNIFDRQDCLKLLRTTGCDGVALGRLAIARPWIFAEWTHDFRPPQSVFQDTAYEVLDNLAQTFDPSTALRRFNRFAAYYSANFQFGHTWFSRICRADSLPAVDDAIRHFFRDSPIVVERPRFEALGR
jgi:nifR3 family TIM-barrel protein